MMFTFCTAGIRASAGAFVYIRQNFYPQLSQMGIFVILCENAEQAHTALEKASAWVEGKRLSLPLSGWYVFGAANYN